MFLSSFIFSSLLLTCLASVCEQLIRSNAKSLSNRNNIYAYVHKKLTTDSLILGIISLPLGNKPKIREKRLFYGDRKIAHEITMVLLQGQYASRPAANTDFARSAAKEYVDCKRAIIGRLKELSAQDGI